jgi:hypothetical protein
MNFLGAMPQLRPTTERMTPEQTARALLAALRDQSAPLPLTADEDAAMFGPGQQPEHLTQQEAERHMDSLRQLRAGDRGEKARLERMRRLFGSE